MLPAPGCACGAGGEGKAVLLPAPSCPCVLTGGMSVMGPWFLGVSVTPQGTAVPPTSAAALPRGG